MYSHQQLYIYFVDIHVIFEDPSCAGVKCDLYLNIAHKRNKIHFKLALKKIALFEPVFKRTNSYCSNTKQIQHTDVTHYFVLTTTKRKNCDILTIGPK